MKLLWEYSLPTNEKSTEYQYEAPILVGADYVYYAVKSVGEISLHAVNVHTGAGTDYHFPRSSYLFVNPDQFFGFFHNGLAFFYAGDLHVMSGETWIATIPLSDNKEFNSWLQQGDRLYLAIGHRPFEKLLCIDLASYEILWTRKIGCTKNYRAGAISFFEGKIACYGLDHLLFVNPEDGTIDKQLKLPRIEKLFCPIRQEDGTLLIGYTNWTNAGVLRYDENTGTILWRHKRKFEGPLGNCEIYPHGDCVYWTKKDTELICLNRQTGEEVNRVRTAPWRYTALNFQDGYLLFGTSGADGYLYCLNAKSAHPIWTVPLKEGCSFFAVSHNSVYTGDYSKKIFSISLSDGKLQEIHPVDAEVIGDIKIRDNSLYTILWGNESKAIRLVKAALG